MFPLACLDISVVLFKSLTLRLINLIPETPLQTLSRPHGPVGWDACHVFVVLWLRFCSVTFSACPRPPHTYKHSPFSWTSAVHWLATQKVSPSVIVQDSCQAPSLRGQACLFSLPHHLTSNFTPERLFFYVITFFHCSFIPDIVLFLPSQHLTSFTLTLVSHLQSLMEMECVMLHIRPHILVFFTC